TVEGNVALEWTISDDKADGIEEQVATGLQALSARVVESMVRGEKVSPDALGMEMQQLIFPKVMKEFMTQKVPLPWAGRATIRVGEPFPNLGLLAHLYIHDGQVMEIESVLLDKPARKTGPMRKGTADAR